MKLEYLNDDYGFKYYEKNPELRKVLFPGKILLQYNYLDMKNGNLCQQYISYEHMSGTSGSVDFEK
jgi:hypothetical protein